MGNKTWTPLVISVLLFCLSLSNLVFIWTSRRNILSGPYTYRGHDFPDTLPLPSSLPKAFLTVEESSHYALSGNRSDDEWFSLASTSYGYVRLGLHNRVFVVTMFHQLHCLRMLNLGFNPVEAIGDSHLQHCLSYLRQMILCDPDLTLEPAGWEQKDFESHRVGATHVCQDWSFVYNVVDENYRQWKEKE